MLKRLLSHISLYSIGLPFNLNWNIVKEKVYHKLLSESPIVVYDVGARGGEIEELRHLYPVLHYIGFDADTKAAQEMESIIRHRFYAADVYPIFVGEDIDEPFTFYIYKYLGLSSRLLPDKNYIKRYEDKGFEVVDTFVTTSISLNTAQKRYKMPMPDMLKLDTQGTEYEILSGANDILESVLFIESETMFTPMYENQKLFHHISAFLYEHEFEVVYINRAFYNRKLFYGESRGQMMWGDFLFCKKDTSVLKMSRESILKHISLLVAFGLIDIAYDIVQKTDKISSDEKKAIISTFRFYSRGIIAKLYRAGIEQLHKIIVILLRILRTNREQYDYDRSWNIR